jgi:hypothetical protein
MKSNGTKLLRMYFHFWVVVYYEHPLSVLEFDSTLYSHLLCLHDARPLSQNEFVRNRTNLSTPPCLNKIPGKVQYLMFK